MSKYVLHKTFLEVYTALMVVPCMDLYMLVLVIKTKPLDWSAIPIILLVSYPCIPIGQLLRDPLEFTSSRTSNTCTKG